MALVVYQGPSESLLPVSSGIGINSDSTNDNSSRFVGLSNQGATCYLNGLLQTLFMTPEFRRAIFLWNYDPSKHGEEEWCITLQLQRLFGQLQLSKQRSVDTVALTHSFGWEGSEVFQQQDVQELTRVLFDALEETFKGTEVENIIDDLYAGELIDYLRCIDVDYQSERVDKFLDFSLAIVPFGSDIPMRSLTECIEMYLRPEILDGDNKYFAEKFDMKVDAIKGLKFGKLPQIMSVQLKRFVYDFSGPMIVQKKLNDVVKFPMILDMNSYVGRRSSASRPSDDNNSTDADQFLGDERVSNEFEQFLVKQMESLKSSRGTGNNSFPAPAVHPDGPEHTESPINSSPPKDVQEGVTSAILMHNGQPKSSEGDLETVALDSRVKNEPSTCQSAQLCPPLASELSAEGSDDDVKGEKAKGSEMVDSSGTSDTVVYDSMTAEEVKTLVERRGEWVYELYAVLIHAGVINGGHYYAYIKDLTTSKWWNFNDSTVTCIDEKTVQEAWGKRMASYQYGSSYGGTSYGSSYGSSSYYGTALYGNETSSNTGSLSTANAYMLMYRKVSLSHTGECVGEMGRSNTVITDDLVPQYIRDQVEEEERREAERRRLVEEERNKLHLRVYFNGTEHVIHTRRYNTYESFLRQLWDELRVAEHLGESLPRYRKHKRDLAAVSSASSAAVIAIQGEGSAEGDNASKQEGGVGGSVQCAECSPASGDPPSSGAGTDSDDGPCFDLFRLRNYNTFTQMKTESFECESSGKMTLEELAFRDHRTFLLETRSGEDEWEVFYVDGISVHVIEFDAQIAAFKEPRIIRLRRKATLGECRKMVSTWVSYPYDQIRLMKIANYGHNDAMIEILINDDVSLRDELFFYDGYKLYAEDARLGPESPSLAAFVNARNVIEVRVNKPPSFEFDLTVKVDLRWTVPQLRSEIKRVLDIPEQEEIRVFKQTLRGQELRDGPTTLATNGIYNNIGIAVCKGQATPIGFFCISLMEYVPTDHRVGVVELPLLEPHEEDFESAGNGGQTSLNDIDPGYYHKSSNEDSPPPPLIPLFSDMQSADDNAEWNAALDAVTDNDSNASNTGVADVDELQQLDDDLEYAVTETCTSAGESIDLVAADASLVDGSGDFDKGAAKVAKNCNTGGTQGSYASNRGRTDPLVNNFVSEGQGCSVSAIPILNVAGMAGGVELPMPNAQHSPRSRSVSATVSCTESNTSLASHNDDVQPSDFGQKLVSNLQSASNFTAVEGVTTVFVQNTSTFLEIKTVIAEKLIEVRRLAEGTSPHCIRLRDKLGNNPGKILCGEGTFGGNQIYLYDHKVFAYQVLEHEEHLPVQESGNMVALVQRWNRAEWRLEDRFEVLLRGDWSVRNISRGLCSLTGIPLDSMQAMVLSKDSEFLLSDLNLKSPPRSYGRAWFDPTKETRLLRATVHEMRIADGDVLLLQDTTEPLRVLSLADRKSIELMRIASGDNEVDFWSASNSICSQASSARNPFGSNGHLPGAGSTSMKARRGYGSSNGVHIRSQKDRQQEASDRSLNSTAATNGEASKDQSGVVTPATAEAGENEYAYSENNIDDKEFEKQGGMALFSDIN